MDATASSNALRSTAAASWDDSNPRPPSTTLPRPPGRAWAPVRPARGRPTPAWSRPCPSAGSRRRRRPPSTAGDVSLQRQTREPPERRHHRRTPPPCSPSRNRPDTELISDHRRREDRARVSADRLHTFRRPRVRLPGRRRGGRAIPPANRRPPCLLARRSRRMARAIAPGRVPVVTAVPRITVAGGVKPSCIMPSLVMGDGFVVVVVVVARWQAGDRRVHRAAPRIRGRWRHLRSPQDGAEGVEDTPLDRVLRGEVGVGGHVEPQPIHSAGIVLLTHRKPSRPRQQSPDGWTGDGRTRRSSRP